MIREDDIYLIWVILLIKILLPQRECLIPARYVIPGLDVLKITLLSSNCVITMTSYNCKLAFAHWNKSTNWRNICGLLVQNLNIRFYSRKSPPPLPWVIFSFLHLRIKNGWNISQILVNQIYCFQQSVLYLSSPHHSSKKSCEQC